MVVFFRKNSFKDRKTALWSQSIKGLKVLMPTVQIIWSYTTDVDTKWWIDFVQIDIKLYFSGNMSAWRYYKTSVYSSSIPIRKSERRQIKVNQNLGRNLSKCFITLLIIMSQFWFIRLIILGHWYEKNKCWSFKQNFARFWGDRSCIILSSLIIEN